MKKLLYLAISIVILNGCAGPPSKDKSGKELSTPVSGEVSIGIDESLKPVADDVLQVFSQQYTKAHVKFIYGNETKIHNLFLADSVQAILSTRLLNPEEVAYFKKIEITPKLGIMAKDALALIGNKEILDTVLDWKSVDAILSGKAKTWSDAGLITKNKDLEVVFSENGSSSIRYFYDIFIKNGKEAPSTFMALNKTGDTTNGNTKVIEYVKAHKNAIGVIGVNWISNIADAKVQKFRSEIKTLAIYPADTMIGKGSPYKPYQAYIAMKGYPFIRTVYMHNREGRAGLGSGFASFFAGPIGQKIVASAGLIPAKAQVRIVEFKK